MGVIGKAQLQSGEGTGQQDLTSFQYTDTYVVEVQYKSDHAVTVLNAPGLPKLGDSYRGEPYAVCVDRQASRDQLSDQIWRVTITYGPESASNVVVPTIEFGLLRRFESLQFLPRESLGVDPEGITNSAGQPFDPAPQREVSILTMRINARVKYNLLRPERIQRYRDTINSKFLLGFEDESARLVNFSAMTVPRTTIDFGGELMEWDVGLEWHIKDSWVLRELDRGTMELDDDGKLVQIIDVDGVAVTQPVMLDGEGRAVNNTRPSGTGNQNAVFLEFDVYKKEDHTQLLRDLELPTDFAKFGSPRGA
jgi:hypothetical protein